MKHYLGVDIGTFETKGVIVDQVGRIVATAARPHQMLVPQPGWAEHRPQEDWWGDFVFVTRKMLADSRIAPSTIAAIGTSAIGPCMLPVDAAGAPLMNGVLYGIDTRATAEIDLLTEEFGEQKMLDRAGTLLSSQAVGPKLEWVYRNEPEVFERATGFYGSNSYVAAKLTGGPRSRGGVASQGASQSRLTARTRVQASRSRRVIGRSVMPPSRRVTGQPVLSGRSPAPARPRAPAAARAPPARPAPHRVSRAG